MRYIVYGAGGVGGAIGARLFHAGHEVVLIARGEHLRVLQHRGLHLKTPQGSITGAIPAVGHPGEIAFQGDEAVLLCMKTQDTENALRALLEVTDGADLPIVCAQNGVENERIAARRFPRAYGMTVWLPAVLREPGVVLNYYAPRQGVLDCGRYPHGTDLIATRLSADLDASGFSSRAVGDIMRWKYSKLLTNLRGTVRAVCGWDAPLEVLTASVIEEARRCYAAAGIPTVTADEERKRQVEGQIAKHPIEGEAHTAGSASQSLLRGSGSIETDYINGEIVLLGTLHDVATPFNATLQKVANDMARRRLQPGVFTPDEVVAMARRATPLNQVEEQW